jgi:sulfite exporter TauE/SafE
MDITYILSLLGGCFALGMLHGVIPDEHTWPITFAYSVGTTTGKGGVKSAGYFTLAFTLQRAIMSQLVFFTVAIFLISNEDLNGPVYFFVGLAMAIAGFLILTNRVPKFMAKRLKHNHAECEAHPDKADCTVPIHWCIIHGFISGFGVDTGIFTTFVYLTTLPVLASAGLWEVGWLPGFLFGIGTFVVMMAIGFFFGETLQIAKRYGKYRIEALGRLVGARILLFGGVLFMLLGPAYWLGIADFIPIEFGTFIALLVLVAFAVPIMLLTWREVRRMPDAPMCLTSILPRVTRDETQKT